jgi:hypothetical protein
MRAVLTKTQFVLMLAGSVVFAGTPAIGIVTASGHFMLENSVVWGNSTLFDGSTVETGQASSSLALRNGVKIELGAASKANVFADRAILERGVGVIAGVYEIDAAGLKIKSSGARLRVAVSDRVEVDAVSGTARVSTSAGLLLASIPAGRSMNFSMQAGSTGAVTRTGCLLYKDGHFILQDEYTLEVSELSGGDAVMRDLRTNAGNRVQISGGTTSAKPAVAAATISINVVLVTAKSTGGCLSVAATLDAQTEAPAGAGKAVAAGAAAGAAAGGAAGAAAGLSTGAIIGIVAAVAGGGAAAALVATHSKSSTSP